jgi:Fe-S oxidoreductase
MVTWHRKPLKDLVDRCFRCGLCRAVCPVFLQDGREPAVARAKLQLIAALSGKKLPPNGHLAYLLSRCLSCGACETVCPADAAVTEAVLRARCELVAALNLDAEKVGLAETSLIFGRPAGRSSQSALDSAVPADGARRTDRSDGEQLSADSADGEPVEIVLSRWRRYLQALRSRPARPLAAVLAMLSGRPAKEPSGEAGDAGDDHDAGDAQHARAAQRTVATQAAGETGQAQPADDPGAAPDPGAAHEKQASGLPRTVGPLDARMKVAYFPGCADLLWPRLWESTFELFRRAGVRVVMPTESLCCGYPFLEAGDPGLARQLANENIKAFGKLEVEAIVTGCSTGGRMLGRYTGEILGLTGFPIPVYELGEFLVQLDREGIFPELKTPVPVRIAYLPPRGLERPTDGALQFLNRVSRLEPVLLEDDQGCGGSLFFAALHPNRHEQIMERTVEAVVDRRCRAVVAHSPLTMYLLDRYLESRQMNLRVVHLAEILAMACSDGEADVGKSFPNVADG